MIIKKGSKILGYFISALDEKLSNSLGFIYGRLKSLALDSNIRGLGLGKQLFSGTIEKLISMGADYIDSGYATKNHTSGFLHTYFFFFSNYEEVTLHKWL